MNEPKAEMFYWLTIMCSQTLGTALGDWTADSAGLGYLGMLAGPAIIGPLTQVIPLNLTFFLPVAFCVAAAFTAGSLRSQHNAPTPLAAETV